MKIPFSNLKKKFWLATTNTTNYHVFKIIESPSMLPITSIYRISFIYWFIYSLQQYFRDFFILICVLFYVTDISDFYVFVIFYLFILCNSNLGTFNIRFQEIEHQRIFWFNQIYKSNRFHKTKEERNKKGIHCKKGLNVNYESITY